LINVVLTERTNGRAAWKLTRHAPGSSVEASARVRSTDGTRPAQVPGATARSSAVESTASAPPARNPRISDRGGWVDVMRGAAAVFAFLHHAWLGVWPRFPRR